MAAIKGVLFDKDGTLFNFHATWGAWSLALLADLSGGDAGQADRLGAAIGFDPVSTEFAEDSPVIACTTSEIAELLLPHLPGMTLAGLVTRMNTLSASAVLAPAVPLIPFFDGLRARGLKIGLATNDAEGPARAHLASVGVAGHFDYVAGFDSGHGGKPGTGMLLAFANAYGLNPVEVVMVGDSAHDLIAGRAAGMPVVAVLTGVALADVLTPLADVVLPDIGHLPAWLDGRSAAVAAV